MPCLSGAATARAALLLCCTTCLAHAGDTDTIATDRPDFVESSNVVGAGRFQIETSFAVDRNRDGARRERGYATPTLLRYGVSDTLELRFETDGRVRTETRTGAARSSQSGYADAALGVKWHAADAHGARPSLGVLAHLDFDSGSAAFRAPGMGGSLRVAAEWELPDDYALGVMPGIAVQRDEQGRRYAGGIFAVVLGKEWSERFRTFAELSGQHIARARHGGSVLSADIGAAWLLSDSVQLDTALSRGLNRNTPDYSWTVGLSAKF